eukprot:scaffold10675_cov89-Cylindrotheca_fusiformis.AAC.3
MMNGWFYRSNSISLLNNTKEVDTLSDSLLRRQPSEVDDVVSSTRRDLDKFLADSMLQLSAEERESALDDLHGIRNGGNDKVEEDPASMNRLLEELDRNLKSMKRGGNLYEQAERNDPSYVSSRDFRIMFLRACDYDPEASVLRIFGFLEIQKSLFSQDKIGKKILLEDLDGEAIESIKSGAMQISALTDIAGRKVLFIFPRARRVQTSIQSDARARYYITMAMLESEQVQKMGFVAVYYSTGSNTETANHCRYYSGKLMHLPFRLAGFHACVSSWKTYCLGSMAIYRMPSSAVPKFRIHCGSDMECLYKLASFGIPRDALPLSADLCQLDNGPHLEWYLHRQLLERNRSTAVLDLGHPMIVPGPNDVLFGRFRSNGGNRALRKMVSYLLKEYNSTLKENKTRMALEVMREIGNSGGRFLKLNSAGEWEEVSHIEALEKTAKTFRNTRRYNKRESEDVFAVPDYGTKTL